MTALKLKFTASFVAAAMILAAGAVGAMELGRFASVCGEAVAPHWRGARALIAGGAVAAFAVLMAMNAWIMRDVREREAARRVIEAQARDLERKARQLTSSERALTSRLAEQHRLSEERSALIAALEQSNRELDQYAYVASHDLKTPLRGIASLATWIEEDLGEAVSAEAREQFQMLRRRVDRLETFLDGLREYSRANRPADRPERVDVRKVVLAQVDLLGPPPGVTVRVPERMPTIQCELVPFQRVWMSLLSNAFKHGRREGGTVEITADDRGDAWEFTVRDDGPGVDARYHGRIFGVFQTLAARDRIEGAGIGLALVKKIVESRGGAVSIDSGKGRGAAFRFRWPKRPVQPDVSQRYSLARS